MEGCTSNHYSSLAAVNRCASRKLAALKSGLSGCIDLVPKRNMVKKKLVLYYELNVFYLSCIHLVPRRIGFHMKVVVKYIICFMHRSGSQKNTVHMNLFSIDLYSVPQRN